MGAVIALPFQTILEYQAIKTFFRDFLRDETPHGHSSHKPWRIATKVGVALQALMPTLPLIGFTVCVACFLFPTYSEDTTFDSEKVRSSFSYWVLISMIPFLFAEYTTQVLNLNESYNRQGLSAALKVHNLKTRQCFGGEPRSDYKRDRLMQLIEECKDWIKILPYEILQKLKESLKHPDEDDGEGPLLEVVEE
jgi:hypothetical protein